MRPHLTKKSKYQSMPVEKDSEFYCRFCNSRVTVTKTMGEVGHSGGCPKRPERLPKLNRSFEMDESQCKTCGHTFTSRGRMMTHHALVHGESLLKPKPCDECGVEFVPSETRIRFCSPKCWHEHKKLEEKTCAECNTEFKPSRQEQRYCSHKCYNHSQRDRKSCTCNYCKETFEVPKSRERKYCSTDCMYDDRRKVTQ